MTCFSDLKTSFLSTCSESHGKLTVFSMKAMLATMCGGKIVDKLRCEYISEHPLFEMSFLRICAQFYILSSDVMAAWTHLLSLGNCLS